MSKVLLEVGKSVLSSPPSRASDAEGAPLFEPHDETRNSSKTSVAHSEIVAAKRATDICLSQSRGRRASTECLREALKESKKKKEIDHCEERKESKRSHAKLLHLTSNSTNSTTSRSPSPQNAQDTATTASEELLLQNADLQRKLEVLQRGVVESMKGNKARFMGNGSFKRKSETCRSNGGNSEQGRSYDTLRAAFEKKRVQLEEAEVQLEQLRDDNIKNENTIRELENSIEQIRRAHQDETMAERRLRERELQEERRKSEELLNETRLRLVDLERSTNEKIRKHEEELQRITEDRERERREDRELMDRLKACNDELEAQVSALQEDKMALNVSLSDRSSELELALNEIASLKETLELRSGELDHLRVSVTDTQQLHENALKNQQATTARFQEALRRKMLNMWREQEPAQLHTVFLAWRQHCVESARSVEFDRNISARDAALEESRQEVARLTSVIAQNADDRARAEQTLRDQMEALEKRCSAALHAQVEKQAQLQKAQKELGEKQAQLQKAQKELAAMKQEYQTANDALDKADKLLKANKARENKVVEALKEQTEKPEFFRRREETLMKEIAEWHKENEALQRRIGTLTKENVLTKRKCEEAEKEAANLRKQLRKEADARKQLEDKIDELEATVKAKDGEIKNGGDKSDHWKKKYLEEKERATKAEKICAEAQEEAEELAAAKRRVDEINRNLEFKCGQPKTSEFEQRHKEQMGKKEEAIRALEAEIKGLEQKHKDEHKDLYDQVEQWRQASMDAARDVRKSVRMLVTAPKVSINVGGNETPLNNWAFPFEKIRTAVSDEILPRFSKCISVSENFDDREVKDLVQNSVEELALTLQSKVYELMPQAEGTCNWDGFGARRSGSL